MMKAGMVLFDVVALTLMCALWGAASWAGFQAFEQLDSYLWTPVAIVLGVVSGLLALITLVGVLHRLLPRIKPGRYTLLKDPMFFIWVTRFILYRALFAPGLQSLLFQFNVLRFLSLRALGAKVSLSASMSSDITLLDPWLLEVEDGATIGTGCLVSGHFIDQGKLLLQPVKIGANSLLAARVVVAPGADIGQGVRVLAGVMMGVGVRVEDRVTIGPDARLDADTVIGEGVKLAASTFVHRGVRVTHDTKPLEVIHPASSEQTKDPRPSE